MLCYNPIHDYLTMIYFLGVGSQVFNGICATLKHLFFVLVLSLGWLLWPAPASAQPPDGRPDIRLPLPGGDAYTVSCGYGCYQHKRSMEYAVDFDVSTGTPVVSAGDGIVSAITWEMGLPASLHLGDALIVYIDHDDGWFTRYVHLDGITVKVGQTVRRGQIIGYAGGTGAADPHLHFELKYGESLHAPSQPIDDLFDDAPPEAGAAYPSENTLDRQIAITDAQTAPAVTPLPTPTDTPAALGVDVEVARTAPLALVEGLSVSTDTIDAGVPVSVTFALRNNLQEPLALGVIGVGARDADNKLVPGTVSLMRVGDLEPGATIRFKRLETFEQSGDLDLFVFTFSPEYELLPIGVDNTDVNPHVVLHVNGPEHSVFLPVVTR